VGVDGAAGLRLSAGEERAGGDLEVAARRESPRVAAVTDPDVWWRNAVVYQIYPRSFADGSGDGVGDLRGVLEHLDHLAELGVDVVWISPVYPSPQEDNGYDISDYTDVDPLFGSLADLDALIDGLHERGMRLVLDLVVNHTSSAHPWFVASRSSRDDPKRDWYWWRPPRAGFEAGRPGAEPTNWRSFFSGPAWTLDETTGEYYLHIFAVGQPDLNWENPEVRAEVHAMMRWWLDRGVDGFRMDVINFISKDPALPDGRTLTATGGTPDGLADGSAAYIDGPRIHEFLAEMHHEVFDGRDQVFLTVGEMPGVTVDEARRFTDPARREVDMVFQFEHVNVDHGPTKWDVRPLHLPALKAIMSRWQTGLADVGWNSLYWNNHDQPRVVSRFGDDGPQFRDASAKALGTVLHLHRGTPYVYQGEELGMANFPFTSIEEFRDVESLNHYRAAVGLGEDPAQVLAGLRRASRDNARTPMQWDAGDRAGFCAPDVTPWIAVNPDHAVVNAQAQRKDPESVFTHYRRLIELRHTVPAVALGDFTMLLPEDEHVYAFIRSHEGVELLVLANLSSSDADVAVPAGWSDAELLVASGSSERPVPPDADGRWRPAPWDALVIRR
jgi:oligo-1,6-glucosidase